MRPPTCSEARRLAAEAIADDARMTPGPWKRSETEMTNGRAHCVVVRPEPFVVAVAAMPRLPSPDDASGNIAPRGGYSQWRSDASGIAAARTREPQLARFVEAVIGATGPIDDDLRAEYQPERLRCVTMGPRVMLPATARAIAARLLRAADEAEADAGRGYLYGDPLYKTDCPCREPGCVYADGHGGDHRKRDRRASKEPTK